MRATACGSQARKETALPVDLVVKNGTIVTSSGRFRGGVAIDDGVIVAIADEASLPDGAQTIDASGQYVLPGVINPHVHFREPGLEYKEDFQTGSTAAVMGGVTCVVDMPNTKPPTSTPEVVELKKRLVEERSYCDIAILAVVVQENVDQIMALADAGVCGYKVFLGETIGSIPAPDDGMLLDAFELITKTGRRIGFHAENDQILQHRIRKLKAEGRTDAMAHLESRPAICEAESIQRMALFASYTGTRIHIFHLSSRDGLETIREWRRKGVDITTETGEHYTFLDATVDFPRLGSVLRMNPPIRSKEHGEALFQGLLDGSIEAIGTDHSPHTREEKLNDDIWKAISGFVSVETSLATYLSMGVNAGRMTLEQLVRVTSEGPARIWDLYPQKGALQLGSDGDLTIVDLDEKWTIDESKLHSKNNVTPFDGVELTGRAVATIVRGQVVMRDGELVADEARGKPVVPEAGQPASVGVSA
jgi:dihydroorotase/allantoinase